MNYFKISLLILFLLTFSCSKKSEDKNPLEYKFKGLIYLTPVNSYNIYAKFKDSVNFTMIDVANEFCTLSTKNGTIENFRYSELPSNTSSLVELKIMEKQHSDIDLPTHGIDIKPDKYESDLGVKMRFWDKKTEELNAGGESEDKKQDVNPDIKFQAIEMSDDSKEE